MNPHGVLSHGDHVNSRDTTPLGLLGAFFPNLSQGSFATLGYATERRWRCETVMTSTSRKSTRKRRRFQFSLRTLLLAVFLCSLPLSWVAIKIQEKEKERWAVAELEKLQAAVEFQTKAGNQPPGPAWVRKLLGEDFFDHVVHVRLKGLTDDDLERLKPHLEALLALESLSIEGYGISDAGLGSLSGLSSVRRLHIDVAEIPSNVLAVSRPELLFSKPQLTDEGLEYLRGLSNLEHLHIEAMTAEITDDGLEYLKALKKLKTLSLNKGIAYPAAIEKLERLSNGVSLDHLKPTITDEGLKHISELEHLEDFAFSGTRVTDDGLAYLKRMPNLRSLSLGDSQVTDHGTAHLTDMAKLMAIGLNDCDIGDDGLANLKQMKNLRVLSLQGTKVTDKGLVHLEGLSNLVGLHLHNTQVTFAGVKRLRKALPGCDIKY